MFVEYVWDIVRADQHEAARALAQGWKRQSSMVAACWWQCVMGIFLYGVHGGACAAVLSLSYASAALR